MKITQQRRPPVIKPPVTITLELTESEFSDLQIALTQYVKAAKLEHYIATRIEYTGTFDIAAAVRPILDYEVEG